MAENLWMIPFLLFLAVFVFGLMLMRNGLAFRRSFRRTAESLGLHWDASGLFAPGEVSGTLEGESIEIFVSRQGMGSFERLLTVVQVDISPALPVNLHLARENVLNRLSHRFGVHDMEFGDPAFDDLYRVTGDDEEGIRKLLTPEVRGALVEFGARSSDIHVSATRLRWECTGRVNDPNILIRTVQAGVAAVRAMRMT